MFTFRDQDHIIHNYFYSERLNSLISLECWKTSIWQGASAVLYWRRLVLITWKKKMCCSTQWGVIDVFNQRLRHCLIGFAEITLTVSWRKYLIRARLKQVDQLRSCVKRQWLWDRLKRYLRGKFNKTWKLIIFRRWERPTISYC